MEVFYGKCYTSKLPRFIREKSVCKPATIMLDGSPQVTPVWVELADDYIFVNSARGRQKDKNMRSRPKVALSIQDPANPYRYLEVRGRVVEVTEKGADEHIDKLTKKYLGVDKYPYRQKGEIRVIYKIKPEKTSSFG